MNKLRNNCKHILQMRMHLDLKTYVVGMKGIDDPEWIKHRLEIFKTYTLKSILHQTNRDFITWILWRLQDKDKPFIQDWRDCLTKAGLDYVFTFHPIETMGAYTDREHNELAERTEGIDYLYVTRCDTDDMLHETFMDLIQGYPVVHRRAMLPKWGYIFDINRSILKEMCWQSPPFYSIIFPKDVFFRNNNAIMEYTKSEYHTDIKKRMESIMMMGRIFVHILHGKNIIKPKKIMKSEIENYITTSGNITSGERRLIMKQFGLGV